VFINGMVASAPHIPVGGLKHSGYEPELGVYGIKEFVNILTIIDGQRSPPPRATAEKSAACGSARRPQAHQPSTTSRPAQA